MPDISVIIPAYNRSGLIGETLRSLLNQTLPAKEIIVVDDGSTDGTAEKTLEAFENWKLETGNLKKDGREQFLVKSSIQHPTLKILHQANAGPGAARNRGLAEATGEFIHFFDSDDIAAPNKHEVQLRALIETGADIAYGPWVKGRFAPHFDGRGEFSAFSFQLSGFSAEGPALQARGLPEGDLVRALLTNWSIVPHACLYRHSILEKAGGFPEDLWVGEDQLLFLRCLLAGANVVHTPETQAYYRVGNDLGKLTAAGAAQKRHARDWARFLLKANQEVEEKAKRLKSKVVKVLATGDSLPATASPSSWFGFRLRAYEAWRDLEKFFPGGEGELIKELQGIWRRSAFSALGFRFVGFLIRKFGGLKLRVLGHREHASFRCAHFSTFIEGAIKK